jgi:hypothetical protein
MEAKESRSLAIAGQSIYRNWGVCHKKVHLWVQSRMTAPGYLTSGAPMELLSQSVRSLDFTPKLGLPSEWPSKALAEPPSCINAALFYHLRLIGSCTIMPLTLHPTTHFHAPLLPCIVRERDCRAAAACSLVSAVGCYFSTRVTNHTGQGHVLVRIKDEKGPRCCQLLFQSVVERHD